MHVTNETLAMVLTMVGILFTILIVMIGRLGSSVDKLSEKLDAKVSKESCRDIRDDCFRTCPIRRGNNG